MKFKDAITSAKQIDEQSKVAGFYEEALDHVARQGYGNAQFEVDGQACTEIADEFFNEGVNLQHDNELSNVQDIKKRLLQSVHALN